MYYFKTDDVYFKGFVWFRLKVLFNYHPSCYYMSKEIYFCLAKCMTWHIFGITTLTILFESVENKKISFSYWLISCSLSERAHQKYSR